jgi:hypothetical protein
LMSTWSPDPVFSAQYSLCKDLVVAMARRCSGADVRFALASGAAGLRAPGRRVPALLAPGLRGAPAGRRPVAEALLGARSPLEGANRSSD